jgi:hypothetical protein
MAMAWSDLMEQGGSAELQASRWLIEHLLQAEEVSGHKSWLKPLVKIQSVQVVNIGSASTMTASIYLPPQKR